MSSPTEALALERERLLGLVNASWTTQVIGAAVRLGLPAALAEGARHVDALAATTTTQAPSLRRLLEALATLGLVADEGQGAWVLVGVGRLLLPNVDGSLAAWAEFCAGPSWDAWRRLDDSVRTGASQRRRQGFAHLDDDVAAAGLFNRAMRDLTAPIAAALAERIDLGLNARVIDVGGGEGELLVGLLSRHSQATGCVFDLAHAASAAMRRFAEEGLTARASFVAGDFFVAVPGNSDVYLLKSVLHDWDDDDAVRILRSVAAAMSPSARLFVLERLRPQPAGFSPVDRAVARSDLNMLVGTGGKERSEAAYHKLLESSGLDSQRTLALLPGYGSIEAILRGREAVG